jgi:hypothetical protein
MGTAAVDRETLAPEEVRLLELLSGVGGCAPVGGLLGALGADRKQGRRALATLAGGHFVNIRPMLGEELVQMTAPAWESLGLAPQVTTRLTYKRIRTGDLSLQYYAEFGRHLSSEVATGLPQERRYKELKASLADLGRQITRKKGTRDRHAQRFSQLMANPEAQEKDRRASDTRRTAADREMKRLRAQKGELLKENEGFLASFKATNRLDSNGVYLDPGQTAAVTWVALDLGYLEKTLPESLQRCDAVAGATGEPWRLWVWGVERADRSAIEEKLRSLLESQGLRRPPLEVLVLPYARAVR